MKLVLKEYGSSLAREKSVIVEITPLYENKLYLRSFQVVFLLSQKSLIRFVLPIVVGVSGIRYTL